MPGRTQQPPRSGQRAAVVEMDVTGDASVNAGVEAAIQAMAGIDIVVNNVGLGVLGVQETFAQDDFKRLFDVNVFGVQRVIAPSCRPCDRKARASCCRSPACWDASRFPFMGPTTLPSGRWKRWR
ncbi:SDR family NAD(P)-dependent oxidoreductase [Ramlibacter ginsenosidimutans]|uniref:SDR family NAD(P)-dependent oxidoreductase n=1 Tax=Ramlibacter ginsenosidimutans TaxID=502333 RepID=A0A934WQ15_9BURK|nr:SDR family NAD(P)-dependent oxidoreductase [Ramlibacter ginsenosidimutans]MBK6008762.1 SDR family NAD(P)-dependent oxidoreductase [Ramlibacter ginsenosidimutans]